MWYFLHWLLFIFYKCHLGATFKDKKSSHSFFKNCFLKKWCLFLRCSFIALDQKKFNCTKMKKCLMKNFIFCAVSFIVPDISFKISCNDKFIVGMYLFTFGLMFALLIKIWWNLSWILLTLAIGYSNYFSQFTNQLIIRMISVWFDTRVQIPPVNLLAVLNIKYILENITRYFHSNCG